MDNNRCLSTGYIALNTLSSAPRGKSIKIKNNEVARDEQPQSHRSLFVVSNSHSFQLF